MLLYRCDTLGVWCHEVDHLGTTGAGQSENGRLRYDLATRTLTASEGEYSLLTYPADDLFESPRALTVVATLPGDHLPRLCASCRHFQSGQKAPPPTTLCGGRGR